MLSVFLYELQVFRVQERTAQEDVACCYLQNNEESEMYWLSYVLPSHVKIIQCSLECFRLLEYSLFIEDQNFEI